MQRLSTITSTESVASSPVTNAPRAIALIPAGLAFILYLVTCSPTVNFTDSGELITVAWTGGIAHPPGYPLYSMLASLSIHLPFGDIAWRMNILSALFAALSVGLYYGLVTDTLVGMQAFQRIVSSRSFRPRSSNVARSAPTAKSTRAASVADPGKRKGATHTAQSTVKERSSQDAAHGVGNHSEVVWAAVAGGIAAAGLLAVSVTFWNWATQAKFYTLHFAFVAALLWLALRTRRALLIELGGGGSASPSWPFTAWSPAIRLLHLLVFTAGLSLTNHFLSFLLFPGIVVLVLSPLRYTRDIISIVIRHIGTIVLAGLLPLLIYLYLPIRATMDPLIAWGLPDTWGGFWRHVTAQNYQGFFGAADFGNHLVDAAIYAVNQFGPWLGVALLVPIVTGLIYLWRTDRGLFTATTVTALINLLVVLNYSIREIATYYVPLYMIVLWWAGLGVTQGILWINRQLSATGAPSRGTTARSPAIALIVGTVLPLIGLVSNWGAAGQRDNYTAELFVRNAFKNYRPNAVVLTNYWDLTSTSFYLQNVLNERPDVAIIDKSVLRQPFYLEYLERNYPDLISKNAGPFAEYKALLNEWIETGRTPQRLPAAYLNMLNGFIDTNLGERPVYADFVVSGGDLQEAQEVTTLLESRQSQLVPDGFGYRIAIGADDLRAQDPLFDLRGITDRKVTLDEIEASVIALYPPSLQSIGAYLQNSSIPADKDVGIRLLAQAQELQPFAALQDARPKLR